MCSLSATQPLPASWMFHSFALQAASQTSSQHPWASAALKQITNWSSCSCVTDVPSDHNSASSITGCRQKGINCVYLTMTTLVCICDLVFNSKVNKYSITLWQWKQLFLHLYILDKGISFLLAISFTELSSDAWSGDFWWLQLIHQDKNSLDAVLKSSCSADIINTSKISF